MSAHRFASAVDALRRALAGHQARYMIIGGVAVIARGVRRLTDDLDATLWGPDTRVEALLPVLLAEDIAPRIADVRAFAEESQVLLLRHQPSGTDIDLSVAWLPFEDEALDRARAVSIGGASVPVALPGDLLVYKALAGRQRDWSDIERLLEIHFEAIRDDWPRIRQCVADLSAALERPERLIELENLVRKVEAAR